MIVVEVSIASFCLETKQIHVTMFWQSAYASVCMQFPLSGGNSNVVVKIQVFMLNVCNSLLELAD